MKITIPEITITVPRLTELRRHWRGGLLVLLALALMLSWGYQGAQEAAADATTEVEFSISAPGCDTNNGPEADKCTFPAGSSFTLDMSWNGFSGGHAGNAGEVMMQIHWTGAVSGPNIANGKSLTNNFTPLEGCIPSTTLEPGGDPTRAAIRCFAFPFFTAVATGVMGSAGFNCDSAGVGTITLEHGLGFTEARRDGAHWEDNAVDTLTVNCLPPPQINIENLGQYALPKTCFDVRDDAQNPLFVVCDNDFQGPPASHPACDDGTDTICNDEDPADGLIRVTTAGGDYTTVVSKPAVNHTADPSKLACAAVSGGKCEVTFVNAPETRPWFPWDVPEPKLDIEIDGQVNIIDIGIIVRHFLDKKPLP